METVDKELLEGLRGVAEVRLDESLSRHTTFGIGGPADIYAIAKDADELRRLVALCNRSQTPFFILGAGSNVLVSDKGIRGVTIENRARGLVQDAADAQNDHFANAFSILAQVSRNATVRLNTSFSAVESLSTQK